MNKKKEILKNIDAIPAMPASTTRLIRLLDDDDAGIDEISQTIEYDPGLTANVLKIANSAYFGFAGTIGSIKKAVLRLGTKKVFQLVLAVSLSSSIKKPVKGYDLPPGELWRHSVAVAIASEKLSLILKIKAPDFIFTAGLLHDVGKLAIDSFVNEDFGAIEKMAKEKQESFEVAEREILGIDHAEVGANILERWNLPEELHSTVRWHHCPEEVKGDLQVVDVVHIADALCLMEGIGAGREGLQYRPSKNSVARLGVKTIMLEMAMSQTIEGMNEFQKLTGN